MKHWLIAITVAGVLSAAETPQIFSGVITDTMCGAKHDMKGHSDADCVKLCAKGSAQFALFDGQNVFRLSDQKNPAKFAGQQVKITGTLDPKSKIIKVVSMEAADTK
jgi:hypothetical protein